MGRQRAQRLIAWRRATERTNGKAPAAAWSSGQRSSRHSPLVAGTVEGQTVRSESSGQQFLASNFAYSSEPILAKKYLVILPSYSHNHILEDRKKARRPTSGSEPEWPEAVWPLPL